MQLTQKAARAIFQFENMSLMNTSIPRLSLEDKVLLLRNNKTRSRLFSHEELAQEATYN